MSYRITIYWLLISTLSGAGILMLLIYSAAGAQRSYPALFRADFDYLISSNNNNTHSNCSGHLTIFDIKYCYEKDIDSSPIVVKTMTRSIVDHLVAGSSDSNSLCRLDVNDIAILSQFNIDANKILLGIIETGLIEEFDFSDYIEQIKKRNEYHQSIFMPYLPPGHKWSEFQDTKTCKIKASDILTDTNSIAELSYLREIFFVQARAVYYFKIIDADPAKLNERVFESLESMQLKHKLLIEKFLKDSNFFFTEIDTDRLPELNKDYFTYIYVQEAMDQVFYQAILRLIDNRQIVFENSDHQRIFKEQSQQGVTDARKQQIEEGEIDQIHKYILNSF